MRHLSIDLETYSENDIKLGIPKYVECPNFKILLFAYAWDFGEVYVVDLTRGEEVPADVIDAITDPEVTKHAFNAAFELHCLHRSGILTPYRQWACTQLHGLYLGYPKSLDGIGKALGLPQDKKKSTSGKALIRYFCLPCKPTKRNGGRTRNLPEHDPEKWEAFKEYNAQDVVTEMEVCRRLAAFPVPDALQAEWVTDQKINRHGVLLDMGLVRGALQIDAAEKHHLMQEAAAITGLDNPNSRDQLLKWLNDNTNVEMEKLTKESVAEALEVADDTAAKLLDIRKRTSKTSVKKYEMMNAAVGEDDRVRGILQFYGANRTGRWAGRLIQGQNLPRNYLRNLDLARDLVRRGNREAVALLFGDVGDTLSQLIRTAIIAPEGKLLCISDFSAIEARVLAWLAGEKWVLDAFDRGEDIYCKTASSMFHVPVEKHGANSHLRQKGKIAVLACGYQGWTPALISMGALKMGLTEEELPDIVSRWREANPRIVDFWQKVENAALYVMNTARPVGLDRGIIFAREVSPVEGVDFLTITLPSGRKLFYPSPYLAVNDRGNEALHYRTQIGANWGSKSTYGGKLTENITQAVARDCLAAAITRLADAGYRIVMHVHDEVVIEIDETDPEETLAEVNAFMGDPLPWAPGLHLTAAGFISKYYMKD